MTICDRCKKPSPQYKIHVGATSDIERESTRAVHDVCATCLEMLVKYVELFFKHIDLTVTTPGER